jgi:rhodanese-related sulfurtransferase
MTAESFRSTDPAGARALLEDAHLVVDVRTVEEFEAGHVPGAFNVPLLFRSPMGMEPNPEFLAAVTRHFPRDASLVFV